LIGRDGDATGVEEVEARADSAFGDSTIVERETKSIREKNNKTKTLNDASPLCLPFLAGWGNGLFALTLDLSSTSLLTFINDAGAGYKTMK
jgi:hypothetical protein